MKTNLAHFESKQEIYEAVAAIGKLLDRWGLSQTEWMIGKHVSLYLCRALKTPQEIVRDINVYVLRRALPWKTNPKARITFPPAGSSFARQYYGIQKKLNIAVDLMVIPEHNMMPSFITANRYEVFIYGKKINIESVDKFLFRLESVNGYFMRRPTGEFRDYYFADHQRFKKRLVFYGRIKQGVPKNLRKRVQNTIKEYVTLIRREYPEIFAKIKPAGNSQVKGIVAYSRVKKLTGIAVHYHEPMKLRRGKKYVLLFSHFYPQNAQILPLAKAILTEGGGLLSHAAILCRETKTNCLVGASGLLTTIPDGVRLTVDFQKGTVARSEV